MRNPDTNTLLLVDDDSELLVLLGRQLRLHGFNVLTACNGVEALRIIGEQGPPLVITDWRMPEMDGLTLCRKIRALEGIAFTYVIILTAKCDTDHIREAFEAGANDFVAKPCNEEELLGRLQAAQGIIYLEAAHQHKALDSVRVNAELAMMNAALQRMARQLEQSRKEAEQAARAKSDFLANMSHEIRTPMTAILGFAENLLDPDLSPADRTDAINTICRNGEYLLEIINDILDLCKIDAGKLSTERIWCSPLEVTADVRRLLQMRAKSKGLTIELEYVWPIPESILTDPTRLRQILINLVGNAIKFTETGRLILRTRFLAGAHGHSALCFEVIDTGIGMSPDQVASLFQPFVQGDTSTARRFGGTGLGLTISKHLTEMLGGHISVESHPGKGSRFQVTIDAGSVDDVKMLTGCPIAPEVKGDEERPSFTPHVVTEKMGQSG